jgi:serine/threonine protein kinase
MINLVEKLHSSGLIYCDIKPDNILTGDFSYDPHKINKTYLIDFGIS